MEVYSFHVVIYHLSFLVVVVAAAVLMVDTYFQFFSRSFVPYVRTYTGEGRRDLLFLQGDKKEGFGDQKETLLINCFFFRVIYMFSN